MLLFFCGIKINLIFISPLLSRVVEQTAVFLLGAYEPISAHFSGDCVQEESNMFDVFSFCPAIVQITEKPL